MHSLLQQFKDLVHPFLKVFQCFCLLPFELLKLSLEILINCSFSLTFLAFLFVNRIIAKRRSTLYRFHIWSQFLVCWYYIFWRIKVFWFPYLKSIWVILHNLWEKLLLNHFWFVDTYWKSWVHYFYTTTTRKVFLMSLALAKPL